MAKRQINKRGFNIASLIIVLALAFILALLVGRYVLEPSKAIINDLGIKFGVIQPPVKPVPPEEVGPILLNNVSIVQVSSGSGEIPVQQPDKFTNAGLMTPADSTFVYALPLTIIFDRPISGSKEGLTLPEVQLLYCDFTPGGRCNPTVLQWCKGAAQKEPAAKGKTQFGTEPLSTIYSYYDDALRSGIGGGREVPVGYADFKTTEYAKLHDARDLTEGSVSDWIVLNTPISNKYSELNFRTSLDGTDGNPVTHYQFKKRDGVLYIQFRDNDFIPPTDKSDWYDFKVWNDYPGVLLVGSDGCKQELDGKKLIIPTLPGPGWYQVMIQPSGTVFVRGVGVKEQLPMNTNQVIRFKYQR